ncbi:MAG: hypothetical protein GY702_00305 [Desulfobulbaceae bacterium]|nr:hypothetical protein [Desulfobulbaceae bacterium]
MDYVGHRVTTQVGFAKTAFQWEHIEKLGLQLKRYMRPVLSSADFKGAPAQSRLIEGAELPIIEHLADHEKELEDRIITVNKRMANGENEYVKIKKKRGY